MNGNAIVLAMYAALTGVMLAVTAAIQEWLRSKAAEKVAVEVKAVKDTLVEKGTKTDATLEKIHVLVNSGMIAQLKISAVALRRVAKLSNDVDDGAAADLAEKLLHEHERKQAIVDSSGPG